MLYPIHNKSLTIISSICSKVELSEKANKAKQAVLPVSQPNDDEKDHVNTSR